MKVLYYGAPECSEATLKRLLVVAKEIAFLDRPSVRLGETSGTVARQTQARFIAPLDPKFGVTISAHSPYRGAEPIYQEYLKKDWTNPRFRRAVLEGLNNPAFAERMLQLEANYGDATGQQIREALLADTALRAPVLPPLEHKELYKIDTPGRRIETFGSVVSEASILISGGIVGAGESGCAPLTDDETLASLFAIRGATRSDGTEDQALAILGDEVARWVLPDEVLAQISVNDVLEFRAKTKDAYDAWLAELDSLVVPLEEAKSEDLRAEAEKLVRASVAPKIIEYKREIRSVGKSMFASVVASAPNWIVPAIAVYTAAGPVAALVGALAQAGMTAGKDYYLGKRKIRRDHAVSYLMRLVEETKPLLGE